MKAHRPFAPQPQRLIVAMATAWPALVLAAPASDSPYLTDAQSTHVEDATSKGIGTVNMITCIMSALRADALVNEPNYLALVDESKCSNERASADNSSGSSNAPSYMQAIVNATRATNDEPMRMKAWLSMPQDGQGMTIFVNLRATSAPTDTNPYGDFRIDYCGQPDVMPGQCMMNGYVIGSSAGIQYYETEQSGGGGGGGGGGGPSIKQLALTRSGADSGAGRLSFNEDNAPRTYSFAYNTGNFLRSNGVQEQCFSRAAEEAGGSVWRYGLYDSDTGARITRNSGFPIEYGSGSDTVRGYMGYWGLSVPSGTAPPNNGDTVYQVSYGGQNGAARTAYTYAGAAGRLTKYSKVERPLADIVGVRFTLGVNDRSEVEAGSNHMPAQYEVAWNGTSFTVSGIQECNNGPCVTRDLSSPVDMPVSYFANRGGVRGWSQALGGELFIALQPGTSALADTVALRTQSLVYPSEMPAALECLSNCPTEASVQAYFAPGSNAQSPFAEGTAFNFQPSSTTVAYTLVNGVLQSGDQPVTLTDAQALQQRPQYMGGVRSGRLFLSSDKPSLACGNDQYCDYKVESLQDYYLWETGPSAWNQFAALRDDNNGYVRFDAPLNVDYTVPNTSAFGEHAGRSLVLQYGGFGELWGIPGRCVSGQSNEEQSCDQPNSRYVPAFVIPYDTVDGRVSQGGQTYYAKWLDRELRFARKDSAQCAALTLPSEGALPLPTESQLANPALSSDALYIGAKPTLSSDTLPRVIHGEVKF